MTWVDASIGLLSLTLAPEVQRLKITRWLQAFPTWDFSSRIVALQHERLVAGSRHEQPHSSTAQKAWSTMITWKATSLSRTCRTRTEWFPIDFYDFHLQLVPGTPKIKHRNNPMKQPKDWWLKPAQAAIQIPNFGIATGQGILSLAGPMPGNTWDSNLNQLHA